MRKKILSLYVLISLALFSQTNAHAAFTVNWSNSWDPNYEQGYYHAADWLVSKGYFSDAPTARNFVQNNYIGSPSGSGADPHYWNPALYSHIEAEIVLEKAGYRNWTTLGYYLQGDPANRTQIFSGPEGSDFDGNILTGPRTITPGSSFGFYIHSPYPGWDPTLKTYWHTDRALNYASQAHTTQANPGEGDAQALIYELDPGKEWLVAWEDLDSTHYNGARYTDNDYNDMLVLVRAVPIPEPATLSLLGFGLLGLFGIRKRVIA